MSRVVSPAVSAGGGIVVAGGVGGLAVSLGDLADSAHRLDAVAAALAGVALDVLGARLHPSLAVVSVLAPELAVGVSVGFVGLAGPSGVGGEAVAAGALARSVAEALEAYGTAEEGVERLVTTTELSVGLAVGATSPVLAPMGAVAVAAAGPERVDAWIHDHPWAVPAAAGGLPGAVYGMGLTVPFVAPMAARRGVWPPRSHEDALAVVLAATGGVVLDESGWSIRTVGGAPRRGSAPTSVRDLVADDGPTSGRGRVRVTRVEQPDGSGAWVVDIPGTQTFDPRPGPVPWDLTSNVGIEAGRPTLTTQAVTVALADAQRRMGGPGSASEPILFSGHSQGGMTAAALAADPRVRRRFPGVSHVVTSGSPIARKRIGPGVSVLALEHRRDLVPALEGADNPDRAGWVTVTRDVDLGEDGRATAAHDDALYAGTAGLVDAAAAPGEHADPSLRYWRERAEPFLGGGEARVVDYDVERVRR